MRILVHEFASGGGFLGLPVPAALAREGAAMRDALLADLAAAGEHEVVTTVDPRFPLSSPPRGVEVVAFEGRRFLDDLMGKAEATWLVAPETDGHLARLVARAEKTGTFLLGPSSEVIRRASDKAALARHLTRSGLPHPLTRVAGSAAECREAARELGFPLVVKPTRGAGCEGVSFVARRPELRRAFNLAQRKTRGPVLVQRYVEGVSASVSLAADGRRVVPLAVNAQSVRRSRPFSYRGGETPLDHPQSRRAAEVAEEVCLGLGGLKGLVGVDFVLTDTEAVAIEVNPRLTTAYLGLRTAFPINLARLAIEACRGHLPRLPPLRRSVRFTSSGSVVGS